ncbi:hypothetical protein MXB_170 [Myxobolus squamalis]|nr:hypothetical protein MXB_170 [Myxobolus squamalis]
MTYYDKRDKNISLIRKIKHSQELNSCRLEILQTQEDIITDVLKDAKIQLADISSNNDEYMPVLSNLLLQAAYQLLEPEIVVVCRKKDVELIKTLLPKIQSTYKHGTNQNLIINIDENIFLDPNCAGGLEVLSPDGHIKVDNTLDKRLELIMPKIRANLFGVNKNRRFID